MCLSRHYALGRSNLRRIIALNSVFPIRRQVTSTQLGPRIGTQPAAVRVMQHRHFDQVTHRGTSKSASTRSIFEV